MQCIGNLLKALKLKLYVNMLGKRKKTKKEKRYYCNINLSLLQERFGLQYSTYDSPVRRLINNSPLN